MHLHRRWWRTVALGLATMVAAISAPEAAAAAAAPSPLAKVVLAAVGSGFTAAGHGPLNGPLTFDTQEPFVPDVFQQAVDNDNGTAYVRAFFRGGRRDEIGIIALRLGTRSNVSDLLGQLYTPPGATSFKVPALAGSIGVAQTESGTHVALIAFGRGDLAFVVVSASRSNDIPRSFAEGVAERQSTAADGAVDYARFAGSTDWAPVPTFLMAGLVLVGVALTVLLRRRRAQAARAYAVAHT